MRQVAEHGRKPAMASKNLAHALIEKLIRVKGQHGDVLRRARRGD